jgi:dTDP-glucose 4,6-dehydratase
MQNKKIPIYGNGKNIRDWIYVDDHCEAALLCLLKGKSGRSYNISSNNEIDNLTIVTKILEIMNKSNDLIEFVEDRPGHDLRYSMDSSKISKELEWKYNTNFEQGLEKTIEWYIQHEEYWKDLPSEIFDPTPWKNYS